MRVLLGLLTVLALAGCGGGDAAPEPEPAAPASPAAEAVSLEDFRGEPVIVNVWSSW